MADPFLDLEASIQSSAPREMFHIIQSDAVSYFIASGTRDIAFPDGFFIGSVFHLPCTFVAYPSARTEVGVASIGKDAEVTLGLPLAHPLAQRYVSMGSPPREVTVTIYRQQPGGPIEQIMNGVVTSMGIERHLAKFLIESRLARLLNRTLPLVATSRSCQHVLYDKNCRADRNSFSLGAGLAPVPSLTVLSFDGRVVVISSIGGQPTHWAQLGELVHLPTGERMTILEQVGQTITMQSPIPDLRDGDAITVSAGCAHDIITCRAKFSNQVNFGGFPQLPTKNPFIPGGLGVVEQE